MNKPMQPVAPALRRTAIAIFCAIAMGPATTSAQAASTPRSDTLPPANPLCVNPTDCVVPDSRPKVRGDIVPCDKKGKPLARLGKPTSPDQQPCVNSAVGADKVLD